METLKQQAAGRKGKTIISNWWDYRRCGALALPQLCGRNWTKPAGRTRIYGDNAKDDSWKMRVTSVVIVRNGYIVYEKTNKHSDFTDKYFNQCVRG
jgi:hypothetical protein